MYDLLRNLPYQTEHIHSQDVQSSIVQKMFQEMQRMSGMSHQIHQQEGNVGSSKKDETCLLFEKVYASVFTRH